MRAGAHADRIASGVRAQ